METNLLQFRTKNSTSFIGRPDGKAARAALKLNEFDRNDEQYDFIIPADTTSFNPSFFMGFLGESIETLGVEGYAEKYRLKIENTDEKIIEALKKNLEDGLQNVVNFIWGSKENRLA